MQTSNSLLTPKEIQIILVLQCLVRELAVMTAQAELLKKRKKSIYY